LDPPRSTAAAQGRMRAQSAQNIGVACEPPHKHEPRRLRRTLHSKCGQDLRRPLPDRL